MTEITIPTLAAARDDVGLPADCEAPMADTRNGPHVCAHWHEGHQYHYGGNCWCKPRDLCTAMLQQSLLATERRLRPDNVVELATVRAGRLRAAG